LYQGETLVGGKGAEEVTTTKVKKSKESDWGGGYTAVEKNTSRIIARQ